MKILVIDNDASICRSLVRGLRGHDVCAETDARIAIDRALTRDRQRDPFDVIMCDLSMPELDGLSVVARLRALVTTQPIFVIMSGHHLDIIPPDHMLPDVFLMKPFTASDLEAELARFAERRLSAAM